jgi:hypothetical protein
MKPSISRATATLYVIVVVDGEGSVSDGIPVVVPLSKPQRSPSRDTHLAGLATFVLVAGALIEMFGPRFGHSIEHRTCLPYPSSNGN